MGFLSKLWKGIKKTFKKIFKPIKKIFKSIGKFVGKLGIVGQVAMAFVGVPSIFSMMSNTFGGIAGTLGRFTTGPLGKLAEGGQWFMDKAGKFSSTLGQGFKTVTDTVTSFFGNTAKFIGNKLNITKFDNVPTSFFGEKGVMSDVFETFNNNFDKFRGEAGDLISLGKGSPTAEAAASVAQPEKIETSPVSEAIEEATEEAVKPKGFFNNLRMKPFQTLTGAESVGDFAVKTGQGAVGSLATQSLLGAVQGDPEQPGPAWASQYVPQSFSQPSPAFMQARQEMMLPSLPVFSQSTIDYSQFMQALAPTFGTSPQGIYGLSR